MPKTAKDKHIHKYFQAMTLNGKKSWTCAAPDCTHFMPSNALHTLPGKNTICWNCGLITVLDDINMQMDKPICPTCNFGANDSDIEDILSGKKSIDELIHVPYQNADETTKK